MRTTSLHTFIKENRYLGNDIGIIWIKPNSLRVINQEVLGQNVSVPNVLIQNSCAQNSENPDFFALFTSFFKDLNHRFYQRINLSCNNYREDVIVINAF